VFTGIITKVGKIIEKTERAKSECAFLIETGFSDLSLGESVAINGVCLTVAEFTPSGDASFYASPETLTRTNLGKLKRDSRVNLERALRVGDRLSGHWVQGHVDGVGEVVEISQTGESWNLSVRVPENLERYFVEKGSIALSGVSLTINSIDQNLISLMIIPHTWQNTNFFSLQSGDSVNIEVDILAKLMERQCLYAKQ
jgi:riboflavin synthase